MSVFTLLINEPCLSNEYFFEFCGGQLAETDFSNVGSSRVGNGVSDAHFQLIADLKGQEWLIEDSDASSG